MVARQSLRKPGLVVLAVAAGVLLNLLIAGAGLLSFFAPRGAGAVATPTGCCQCHNGSVNACGPAIGGTTCGGGCTFQANTTCNGASGLCQ